MKSLFCFVLVGSCVSIAAVAQVGPPGGGGANCNVTCLSIIDFYTYVSPAPATGEYPWFAFIEADGSCKRLWRVDSAQLKDPDGTTTQKRYASVGNDVPTCTPTPADNSAKATQASFINAPDETWTTTCYERCDSRP